MKYELYQTRAGQYRWRLRAANGEIIASGEAYKNKADCEACIALVMESGNAPVVELTRAENWARGRRKIVVKPRAE